MEHEKHRIEKMRKDTQRIEGARRRQDEPRWEEAERRGGRMEMGGYKEEEGG